MVPFLFAPQIYWPLSGNVSQDIAPHFNPEIEGIPEVEYKVVTEVASYGKQLGKLTDAVLALAEKVDPKGKEVAVLRKIAKDVEQAKREAAAEVEMRAAKAAERAEKLRGLVR
ncbi:MAG: hypothetical protein AAGF30_12685 [Pseudomonadota bacterium]